MISLDITGLQYQVNQNDADHLKRKIQQILAETDIVINIHKHDIVQCYKATS